MGSHNGTHEMKEVWIWRGNTFHVQPHSNGHYEATTPHPLSSYDHKVSNDFEFTCVGDRCNNDIASGFIDADTNRVARRASETTTQSTTQTTVSPTSVKFRAA